LLLRIILELARFRNLLEDSRPSDFQVRGLFSADTVEKLDKNGGLLFCRKLKHSKLLIVLAMQVHQLLCGKRSSTLGLPPCTKFLNPRDRK